MPAPIAVAVATTSTDLLPDNPARAGFFVQNPSTSLGTVWVRLDGGAAVLAPPCVEVKPGGFFSGVGIGKVTAIADVATTVTAGER